MIALAVAAVSDASAYTAGQKKLLDAIDIADVARCEDILVKLEADKPLTAKNGRKLSIMAYNSTTQSGTPLTEYVRRPYTRQSKPCAVCGAAARATKATGCDYLPESAS